MAGELAQSEVLVATARACVLTCLRAFVGEIIGVAIGHAKGVRQAGFGPSHMKTTWSMSTRCLRLLSFVTLARKLSLRHHAT